MYAKVLKHLNYISEELQDLIDGQSDRLLESTKSPELQTDIQRNVIDTITSAIEEIDRIIESIDNNEYNDDEDNEEQY
jgi:gas vesicle protein